MQSSWHRRPPFPNSKRYRQLGSRLERAQEANLSWIGPDQLIPPLPLNQHCLQERELTTECALGAATCCWSRCLVHRITITKSAWQVTALSISRSSVRCKSQD